jgi:cell fate regulator YaaT (PSP1 superfamily)
MKIAGVRFKENWKVYDFDATGVDIVVGDSVIVESDRGPGFARVVRLKQKEAPAAPVPEPQEPEPASEAEEKEIELETDGGGEGASPDAPSSAGQTDRTLRKIVRKATEEDIKKEEKNREREAEAFKACQDLIAERELEMKLIRVEYSFDASRAVFFFFSESRVDFRELVKELAYKFKVRIEMRQIGVRDVARLVGGYGPCGRDLCCSSFLKNFEPVSIRMAKKQEMVLNPAKISGVCGRLLCCLSYEYAFYDEIKKDVAGLREAATREKREGEERRITEEQREMEARRTAEEKQRQEERKKGEESRREKQREAGPRGGGKPEKRKDAPQDRKGHAPAGRSAERPQQAKQGAQQPQQQKPAQQQQDEKGAQGKRKRRFWRRKRKKQGTD